MSNEKIEAFWENATAKDVERVMAGETVEARFRDLGTEPWTTPRALGGWSNQGWVSGLTWNHCQVYREPSWYAEKPDPGQGFRLLEKFPDEDLKPGDEAFDLFCNGKWSESGNATEGDPQAKETWYRRRVEVEPEPKHYVLRVGDSCETPCGNRTVVTPQGSTQRFLNVKAGDTIKTIHGQTITITAKGFEVTQ